MLRKRLSSDVQLQDPNPKCRVEGVLDRVEDAEGIPNLDDFSKSSYLDPAIGSPKAGMSQLRAILQQPQPHLN